MLDAIIWGLVQGMTEFLPVSSDGHLILVPAFLSKLGWEVGLPDLATTAFLHLGTLAAVLAYFRRDLAWLLRFPTDAMARRTLGLLVVGTIPAVFALFVTDEVDRLGDSPRLVAFFVLVTGVVLLVASRVRPGHRQMTGIKPLDALLIGVAQLVAILPGISRSGMTIAAGTGLGVDLKEAARFSFLLGIPAIAAAGVLEGGNVLSTGAASPPTWVGLGVAAVSGYVAITILLRLLGRSGLGPFAAYCLAVGVLGIAVL
ncbi:MAG TPA: undecaprenyl-diphosphate phosphatase [Acidimicrobiia bacterium]|nr:undecaprenyl-diphosphate phosphatase [Acidimicrobiia bacterium]